MCAANGDWDNAREHMASWRIAQHGWSRRILATLPDHQLIPFLEARDRLSFESALSLALLRRDDPMMRAYSGTWVLDGKAVAFESLAERTRLRRQQTAPEAKRSKEEIMSLSSERASPLLKPGVQSNESVLRQVALQRWEGELKRNPRDIIGTTGEVDYWVGSDAMRAALDPQTVLIEIARFRVRDYTVAADEMPAQFAHSICPSFVAEAGRGFRNPEELANMHEFQPVAPRMSAGWKPPRYAAWIIPSEARGTVQLVDLGDAAQIDMAVSQFHDTLARVGAGPSTDEAIGEATLRRELDKLGKFVLAPLMPYIGDTENWVVSPDGALWLVPWEAFPLEDGRYAVEKHRVSYVESGRFLVRRGVEVDTGPALLVADPNFDLGSEEVAAQSTRIVPDNQFAVRGSDSPDVRPLRWSRLPGTASEAEAITPLLTRWLATPPQTYTGGQALEAVLKSARRPRALVVSTHGFFFQAADYATSRLGVTDDHRGVSATCDRRVSTESIGESAGLIDDPLLRCGLVLAGANRVPRDRPLIGDDGLLTGLEVVGMDLRGTDLVVLSAGDTGLGRVRNGEGVAGLRQAFQLAGARTVVSTLWKIPDQETTELMVAYFTELADGWGKADALCRAQRFVIQSRREKYGAASPFFWAAFTLMGDPGAEWD
jgi:CHAT domain-containing protein